MTDVDQRPPGADLFELVIEAGHVAYYEWVAGSDRIHVSQGLSDLWGHDPRNWTVADAWSVIHPEDQPGYRAARIAYLKSSQRHATFVYRARNARSGMWRWQRDQTLAERDASGMAVRLVGHIIDINDEREREQALREALEHQTATAEVLRVINTSPGNLVPVFEAILDKAHSLCGVAVGALFTFDGQNMRAVASHGFPDEHAALIRRPFPPNSYHRRLIDGERLIQIPDLKSLSVVADDEVSKSTTTRTDFRTLLAVPLRKDGALIGYISAFRLEVRPFSESEIALLENFAAQAVIAMENARLLNEQREALERQTATAEVLQVINASPGNLVPVFDTILEKAMRFCEAAFGILSTYDGKHFRHVATRGVTGVFAEYLRAPLSVEPGGSLEQMVNGANVIHQADITTDEAYSARIPSRLAMAELGGARTRLMVALRKDGALLGVFNIFRQEVRLFSDRQVALLENFAAHAVIAMENARLLDELRAQTEALARRNSEYGERIEHQSATIDVLKAMSSSPGDPQPVFDLIVQRAAEICNAPNAVLFRYDGELLHWEATAGAEAFASSEAFEALRRQSPMPPSYRSSIGRSILSRQIHHVRDIDADPDLYPALRDIGMKSLVGVPLLRDGMPLGVIGLSAREAGGFSDTQVALLQTFAEQAVIAMTSAETYRALQTRTTDLQESLDYQTAISDVLKVISGSVFDLNTVLHTVITSAVSLCRAERAILYRYRDDRCHFEVGHNNHPEYDALERNTPIAAGRETLVGRTMLERRVVQITDPLRDPEYGPKEEAGLNNIQSMLGVPLLRDGALLGVFGLARTVVEPFSERQIELVTTFADQAVIAIENTRLITEQREALEQQTATAEVLQVINASPGDLKPVFDMLLEKGMRLCEAAFGLLHIRDGDTYSPVAQRGVPEAYAEYRARLRVTARPGGLSDQVLRSRQAAQVVDVRETEAYRSGEEVARAFVDLAGARTHLVVPLVKDDAAVGGISIFRQEVKAFTGRQIALLENFAAQAVIAMENARLLNELRQRTDELNRRNSEYGERIEHQSATIDVLKAMSASPGDTQPVFDLIVRHALHACNGMSAALFEYDGELVHTRADEGGDTAAIHAFQSTFPRPPARDYLAGRAILDRQTIHVRDIDSEPGVLPAVRGMGGRTTLSMPLLRDGVAIGAISLNAREPGGFSDSQIELLRTFAEQAVIAITSAETYRALRERTEALAQRNSEYGERIEQQAATIDVLKAMSESPDDTQPVFDLITRRAQELCNSLPAGIFEYDGELVHLRSASGNVSIPGMSRFLAAFPMKPTRRSIACRAILDRKVIHIRDMNAEGDLLPVVRQLGIRSNLAIPLMRDGVAIGTFNVTSEKPGGFTDSQVALVQTFAEQAVIAITSAENFRTLRQRTAELTRSVAELQALEEVLRAVNSSLELETVLATIISRAVQLSDADQGTIYEFDSAEQVFVPKAAFGMTTEGVEALRDRRIRIGETPLGISAASRAPLHITDLAQRLDIDGSRELLASGMHALLAVPLLREDTVVGGLVIRRRAVGGFAPSIPTLLQTFAGQCVLAIENARLFQEARQARVAAETTLGDLRHAQDRLVQAEKMASLGQLTAGIAHEIKNPLNFVNNFADLSVELLNEMRAAVSPALPMLDTDKQAEVDEMLAMVTGNLAKITEHGRRADGIVRSMLEHSRGGSGDRRQVDLNTLVEEALNLAYHGARAQDQSFNITLQRDLAEGMAPIELVPQDITRVLLNLIGNGFYAARSRQRTEPAAGFEPKLAVRTRDLGDAVEVAVRDNGVGIPAEIRDKLFQPFFTTKPSGEGTGLGLSISYDIVTQQHGGSVAIDSKVGQYSEFTIRLPRNPG